MSANAFLPPTAEELVKLLGLIPHPEGGFFVETYRSGSIPMQSKGQTNFDLVDETADRDTAMVTTTGRNDNRPDNNPQRNALTSIFFCPTLKSPTQPLVVNRSDHVHYYQGGLPFRYITYDPRTNELRSTVIGPDLLNGHVLQFPVKGKVWKCGSIVAEYNDTVRSEGDNDEAKSKMIRADYTLLAEAVGPGFDFHDFRFVPEDELREAVSAAGNNDDAGKAIWDTLSPYLHRQQTMDEIEEHYTDRAAQEVRTQQRM